MILKVGITGGIGSGKSTISKLFTLLGIPVYNADDEAKRLMNEDAILRENLTAEFGQTIYSNGLLNRQNLANLVFNDTGKLSKLNAIVHPATIAAAEKWMLLQTAPYALKEAALIFESGGEKMLDKVIGVYCEQELRIQRVMQRDSTTKALVMARIDKQMNEEEKMGLCHYLIINNDKELVIPQVLKIHQSLLELAK